MQKYRDVIFDIEQITAERWDWKVFRRIGDRPHSGGSAGSARHALKASHLAIDALIQEGTNRPQRP